MADHVELHLNLKGGKEVFVNKRRSLSVWLWPVQQFRAETAIESWMLITLSQVGFKSVALAHLYGNVFQRILWKKMPHS